MNITRIYTYRNITTMNYKSHKSHGHLKNVIFLQSEIPRSELNPFPGLRLDGVDALMVVTIVPRVVGRKQDPLFPGYR